ncbi:MAG TPA: FAD-dependent oxidoreductase, partial [Chromatiales bacterium]|nr:FAD-dependent oxidoreductase [Chromatiales bacterium]
MNRRNDFEVIVTGAGMVGAALALALGRQGFRVALVDRRRRNSSGPTRVSISGSAPSPALRSG